VHIVIPLYVSYTLPRACLLVLRKFRDHFVGVSVKIGILERYTRAALR
jgi:hypothetical protein